MGKTYSELMALKELKAVENKNGGLINGNFSFFASKWKLKVKDLRKLYEDDKNITSKEK